MRAITAFVTAAVVVILLAIFLSPPPRRDDPNLCLSGDGAAVSVGAIPAGEVAGYSGEQLRIAALIMKAGVDSGVSLRDQQLAVMVGMGESTLTNVNHGDKVRNDTIGVFQEGPERGPYADRMDPYRAALIFYRYLKEKAPQRNSMMPTAAAHKTQANADPNHYTRFWGPAGQVVAALTASGTVKPSTTAAASPAAAATPTSAASKHYRLPNVKPETQAFADLIGGKFRIRTVGGWRPQSAEKYDPAGHPAGLAVDLMTNDIPSGTNVGNQMAAYIEANAQSLGVKYIIWRQRKWSVARADEGWRPMADRGSPTQNHMDHVHVSLTGGVSPSTDGAIPAMAGPGCVGNPDPNNADAPSASVTSTTGWVAPAKGSVTSDFNPGRIHPIYGTARPHQGTDIGATCGAPIYAAQAGTVTRANAASGYGHLIIIDHGQSLDTRYGHMYSTGVLVKAGQQVKAGQLIGKVGSDGGSTGCHLHFEVRSNGVATDPRPFLTKQGVKL